MLLHRFRDGSVETFDVVFLATGFRFLTPFLPAEVARVKAGHLSVRDGESTSWPGLFAIGTPCARVLDSEFLRGISRDAAPLAERIAERLRR